jgi:predicted anti-sigma-YlaC factor YlaD
MDAPALACVDARELLSTVADDEVIGATERLVLDAHLEGCQECVRFAEQLAAFTRAVRLRPVDSSSDVVAQVLQRSRPPRLGRGGWLRPALAWCGVVIAVQSVRPLVFGDYEGAETHIARHLGAFALALAIGLLYAAWRPQRAFGLMPLAGALLVTTTAAAVLDMLNGDRSPFAETVHVSEFVGMAMLWMVAGSPGWDRVLALFRSLTRGGARSTS